MKKELMESHQWNERTGRERPAEADKTESPRIRLSPNQPMEAEEERHGDSGEEEEEREDRRNLGYEPDSEEEEEKTNAKEDQGEKNLMSRRSMADIEAAMGSGMDDEVGAQQSETEQQHIENEGAERVSLAEPLGEFRRNDAGRMEVPIRPELTIIRQKMDIKTLNGEESENREEEREREERKGGKRRENYRKTREQGRQTTKGHRRNNTPAEEGEEEEGEQRTAPSLGEILLTEETLATREGTFFSTGQQTIGSHLGTSARIRTRRKSFEKPPLVGPLDHVSAISLDEFWQKDE